MIVYIDCNSLKYNASINSGVNTLEVTYVYKYNIGNHSSIKNNFLNVAEMIDLFCNKNLNDE